MRRTAFSILLFLFVTRFLYAVQIENLVVLDGGGAPKDDFSVFETVGFLIECTKEVNESFCDFRFEVFDPGGTRVFDLKGNRAESGGTQVGSSIENVRIKDFYTISGMYEFRATVSTDLDEDHASRSFTISLPPPPTLLSPIGGMVTPTEFPDFIWSPVFGAYFYRIYVGTNEDPEIDPLWEEDLTESLATYPGSAEPLRPGVKYFWRVQALDSARLPVTSNEGRSEIGWFYVVSETPPEEEVTEAIVPFVLEIISPKGEEVPLDALTFTFFSDLPLTTQDIQYEVVVSLYRDMSVVVWRGQTSETSIPYPDYAPPLNYDKRYFWQVTAFDEAGVQIGGRSEVAWFEVLPPKWEIERATEAERMTGPEEEVSETEEEEAPEGKRKVMTQVEAPDRTREGVPLRPEEIVKFIEAFIVDPAIRSELDGYEIHSYRVEPSGDVGDLINQIRTGVATLGKVQVK